MCVVCGFIYEEEFGLPEDGIAPGTRWEDIPDTWQCPDCFAQKKISTCWKSRFARTTLRRKVFGFARKYDSELNAGMIDARRSR